MIRHSLAYKRAFVSGLGGEDYFQNMTFLFKNGREVPQEASLRDVLNAAFGIEMPKSGMEVL